MTEFERFAAALALTESDNDQKAWGDQGLAMGRWQMHPAFVDQWWPTNIEVDWSWDHLFHAALLRFYTARYVQGVTLETVVMEFHLGVQAVKEGRRDATYLARFGKHYNAPAAHFALSTGGF
jgi:hypothetical protein